MVKTARNAAATLDKTAGGNGEADNAANRGDPAASNATPSAAAAVLAPAGVSVPRAAPRTDVLKSKFLLRLDAANQRVQDAKKRRAEVKREIVQLERKAEEERRGVLLNRIRAMVDGLDPAQGFDVEGLGSFLGLVGVSKLTRTQIEAMIEKATVPKASAGATVEKATGAGGGARDGTKDGARDGSPSGVDKVPANGQGPAAVQSSAAAQSPASIHSPAAIQSPLPRQPGAAPASADFVAGEPRNPVAETVR